MHACMLSLLQVYHIYFRYKVVFAGNYTVYILLYYLEVVRFLTALCGLNILKK